MKLNTLIIDNFLDDPDDIRNFLINNKDAFENTGSYPGKRTLPVNNQVYKNMIAEKLHEVLPFKIEMKPLSYVFQLCVHIDQSWVHLDPSDWTGVLYLTPNAPLKSGTLLFNADDETMENETKNETRMKTRRSRTPNSLEVERLMDNNMSDKESVTMPKKTIQREYHTSDDESVEEENAFTPGVVTNTSANSTASTTSVLDRTVKVLQNTTNLQTQGMYEHETLLSSQLNQKNNQNSLFSYIIKFTVC